MSVLRKATSACLFAPVLGLSVLGCTSEQLYTKIQNDRALECQKYPDTRYEECMAQLSGPYDEYEESLPEKDSQQ